jgi:drug/metabolite transporter (DMT)-like permease
MCAERYSTIIRKPSLVNLRDTMPDSALIFFLPALLNFVAQCMMMVGLMLTFASTFQMLRSSAIVFAAVMSWWFLDKRFTTNQWIGLGIAVVGLALYGTASLLVSEGQLYASNPMLGNILVILAQVASAGWTVLDNWIVNKYSGIRSLYMVGWEGLWGSMLGAITLIVVYYIPGESAGDHADNALDGFAQLGNSDLLVLLFLGIILCCGFFGWSSLTLIKNMGATARAMLGTVRIMIVYCVSLSMGWEQFHFLQPVGFTLLVMGLLIFLEVIPPEAAEPHDHASDREDDPIDRPVDLDDQPTGEKDQLVKPASPRRAFP